MTADGDQPGFKVAIIPVTPLQQNCSLMFNDARKEGVVVDPGGDVPRILSVIEQTGVSVSAILLTHGHIDHAGGAAELKEALGGDVPVVGPDERDRFLLDGLAVRNYRAEIDLEAGPGGEGTAIRWHTTFDPKVPGSGWIYRRALQKATEQFVAGLCERAASTGE